MSMTDPVADLLTRIRNAVSVRQRQVDAPSSSLKTRVLDVLKREGYIEDYKVVEDGRRKMIRVYLKYSSVGEPVITEIHRESTPGRRVYRNVTELVPVLRGAGIAVVSTPRGVLSDRECRKEKVGGEVLCKIW
jgi:small subunit ribosomal protein S8